MSSVSPNRRRSTFPRSTRTRSCAGPPSSISCCASSVKWKANSSALRRSRCRPARRRLLRERTMKASLSTLAVVLVVAACDSAVGGESPNVGHSYIVGIDISGSRTKAELDESKKLLDGLIDRLQAGDHLTLIEVYQGGREPAKQWTDSIKSPRDPKHLTGSDERRIDDFKDIARMQTSILFDSARAREIQKTDIFGTLARAADYARASRNRATTLLLLSDMMNETPDVTMTSAQEIPGDGWIRHLAAAKRIPQLRGVCVVVAGADVSSARGAAIRDFWSRYFQAAGTKVSPDNYRNMISDPSEVSCPGFTPSDTTSG